MQYIMDHPSLIASELFGDLSEALQKEVAELVQWSGGYGYLCHLIATGREYWTFVTLLCSAHVEAAGEVGPRNHQGRSSMRRIGQMLDEVC